MLMNVLGRGCLILCLLLNLPSTQFAQRTDAPAQQILVPDPDEGADLLADRAKAQRQTVKEFGVFHEFGFADQVEGSGITFRHRPVADVLVH